MAEITGNGETKATAILEKYYITNPLDQEDKNWLARTVSAIIDFGPRGQKAESVSLIRDLSQMFYQEMRNSRPENASKVEAFAGFVNYVSRKDSIVDNQSKHFLEKAYSLARAQAGLMAALEEKGFRLVPRDRERDIGRIDLVALRTAGSTCSLYFIDSNSLYDPKNLELKIYPIDYETSRQVSPAIDRLKKAGFILPGGVSVINSCSVEVLVPVKAMDSLGQLADQAKQTILAGLESQKMERWN